MRMVRATSCDLVQRLISQLRHATTSLSSAPPLLRRCTSCRCCCWSSDSVNQRARLNRLARPACLRGSFKTTTGTDAGHLPPGHLHLPRQTTIVDISPLVDVLFCSLAVLYPRVGHTMDVLSPFIPVLCHSD